MANWRRNANGPLFVHQVHDARVVDPDQRAVRLDVTGVLTRRAEHMLEDARGTGQCLLHVRVAFVDTQASLHIGMGHGLTGAGQERVAC
jgi:hypothetical protein